MRNVIIVTTLLLSSFALTAGASKAATVAKNPALTSIIIVGGTGKTFYPPNPIRPMLPSQPKIGR